MAASFPDASRASPGARKVTENARAQMIPKTKKKVRRGEDGPVEAPSRDFHVSNRYEDREAAPCAGGTGAQPVEFKARSQLLLMSSSFADRLVLDLGLQGVSAVLER